MTDPNNGTGASTMNTKSIQLTTRKLLVIALACLIIGFIGGLVGSGFSSDSNAESAPVPVAEAQLKGAAASTTQPRTASTIKPGVINIPTTFLITQPTGVPGPPGQQGPAGKDGKGVQGIQWIETGGQFSGCCGEWLVSCPAGTTPITWQALGLAGSALSYAGRSIYSNNANDWMFRASDARSTLDFSTPSARFSLGCLIIS